MAKSNFLIDDSWKPMFLDLPDEAAGQLIKAAFLYHTGEDVVIDDPVLSAVFTMIRERIDENDRAYEETCRKRAEAGRVGWKAKSSKSKQVLANASKSKQTVADSDYDLKEKVSAKADTKKKRPIEEVERIVDHLNAKTGKAYKPTSEKTVSLIAARLREGYTVEDFIAVIDRKVRDWGDDPRMEKYLRPETLFGTKFEGYLQEKTIAEKPRSGTPNKFANFPQRKQTHEESVSLERQLLAAQRSQRT